MSPPDDALLVPDWAKVPVSGNESPTEPAFDRLRAYIVDSEATAGEIGIAMQTLSLLENMIARLPGAR